MKVIITDTIFLVLLPSLILSSQSEASSVPVNAVILQGTKNNCPVDTGRARADLRTEVQTVVSEFAKSRKRACECGYAGAGWRRVVFLNITDPSQSCPGEWELVTSPRRTCRRSHDYACSLAAFSTNRVSYSEVCGRLVGYQYGSTDAIWHPINLGITPDQANSTQSLYDGGVLISHGTAPRQHIWSLVSGYSQQTVDNIGCPCNIGSTIGAQIPSWLGQDYFCDSATVTPSEDHVFYQDNPLWDGVGCNETLTTCCQFNNPPWFCKPLPQPTLDDIELRLCADDPTEGTPIELVEIYVR